MDTSYYVDTSYGVSQTTGLLSFFAGLGIFMWIISMAISILMIVSMWKIFTKAGKPGWAAIIPIYNIYIMCEIADKQWWYILLLCVPIANIYAIFVIYDGIAKKFGKTTGFTIGMMFLPFIFFPILAFEKNGDVGTENVPVQNDLNSGTSLAEAPSNETNLNNNINNESLNTAGSTIFNGYVAPSFEPMGPTEQLNNMSSNATSEQPIMDNASVAPATQNVEQPIVAPTTPVQEEVAPITVEQPTVNSVPVTDQPIMDNASVAPATQSVEQPVITPTTPVQEEVAPITVEQPTVNSVPVTDQPIMDNASVAPVTQSVEQPVVTPTTPVQEEVAPISVEQPTVNVSPVTEQVVTEPISENAQNNVQPVVDIKPEVHTSLWSNNDTNNNQM